MLYIYMLTVGHLSLGGRHGICWLMMFSGFNRITVCQNFRAHLWLANGHQAAVFAGVLTWPCQKHCSGHGWQPAMQVWIFRFSASRWFQNVPTHVSFSWALMVQNPEYAIMEYYGVLRSSHQSFIKPNVGSHHRTILSSMAVIKSPPHHKNDYGDSRTIGSYCIASCPISIFECALQYSNIALKNLSFQYQALYLHLYTYLVIFLDFLAMLDHRKVVSPAFFSLQA